MAPAALSGSMPSGGAARPSVWDLPWLAGRAAFGSSATLTAIGLLWPLLMIAVTVLLLRRVRGGGEPATAVTLTTIAWIVAAPWAMPWYCATGWAALADREPPARLVPAGLWLGAITMLLALVHSSGGHPW